jgi:hypothetical protein
VIIARIFVLWNQEEDGDVAITKKLSSMLNAMLFFFVLYSSSFRVDFLDSPTQNILTSKIGANAVNQIEGRLTAVSTIGNARFQIIFRFRFQPNKFASRI